MRPSEVQEEEVEGFDELLWQSRENLARRSERPPPAALPLG